MATWLERLPARSRSSLRQFLSLLWPSHPTTLAEVPARVAPFCVQVGRLTVAAVIAYLVAVSLTPGILDLTAPLTALLVVQASTVGTLQMGLVRVGAVLTGVLIAVGLSTWIGLSWWSLGAVIAASLVLAKVLRLREQSLETPISAMLILAVASPELAAETRIVNTLIGSLVGIGFSVVLPVSIPSARATAAVRRVARSQAALLDEIALTLADRSPHPEESQAWFAWVDDIDRDIAVASEAVNAVQESRRLNPRALAAARVHPGLRAALDRLDRALAAERLLLLVIAKEAPATGMTWGRSIGLELRRAFAVVLDDVADALRCFGDLVSVEFGGGNVDRVDRLLARTLDIVRETRAVLTELILLDVDPRQQTELWMLQGSVLGAVEQVVLQLDLEQTERRQQAWLQRYRVPGWSAVPRRDSGHRRAAGEMETLSGEPR